MARGYEDTPAGLIRAALGVADPDPVLVEQRAREIKAEVENSRHAMYEDGTWQLSMASAKAVAVAEARSGQRMFTGTTDEFAAALRRRYPWLTITVGPDPDLVKAREHLGQQMVTLTGRTL
jgi:hypothetical protein